MEESSIFLTAEEAVDAISIDFRQYDPQIMLFCSIIGLITDDRIHFKRQPGEKGVWVNQQGRANMRWLEGNDLIEFMCKAIHDTRWTAELLASVCSRVFQSRVRKAVHPETGRPGLQIETNMGSFACLQCGRCCRTLDYHNEVTSEDVDRWKASGRDDILRWVDTVARGDGAVSYRIWVVPETRQLAGTCPFLKKNPTTDRWDCGIHEVKPQICRNYPVSRKHATMTGCRGFGKPQGK